MAYLLAGIILVYTTEDFDNKFQSSKDRWKIIEQSFQNLLGKKNNEVSMQNKH